jgi:hypothetical protein
MYTMRHVRQNYRDRHLTGAVTPVPGASLYASKTRVDAHRHERRINKEVGHFFSFVANYVLLLFNFLVTEID